MVRPNSVTQFVGFMRHSPISTLLLSHEPRSHSDRSQHLEAPTILTISSMASKQDKCRALPKFGEWDVNNPASAEGYTMIFKRARDEKKSSGSTVNLVTPRQSDPTYRDKSYPRYPRKNKWFCCG